MAKMETTILVEAEVILRIQGEEVLLRKLEVPVRVVLVQVKAQAQAEAQATPAPEALVVAPDNPKAPRVAAARPRT
jgi:hypothetical protein